MDATLTTSSPPALSKSVNAHLSKAREIYSAIQEAEGRFRRNIFEILMLAHRFGEMCEFLKQEIGHGNWMLFMWSNFRFCGNTDGTIRVNVERCMHLFRANPNCKDSLQFTTDSVRKFMWGYIPVKARLQLENDEPDRPGAHHLTFINQFKKWNQQRRDGHIERFDIELFRHECEPMLRQIAEIGGRDWFLRVIT